MTDRYESVLWQRLAGEGLVKGEEPALLEDSAPWSVRTMLGIAGWIGALFLLAAVFSGFTIILDSSLAAGILGAIACIISVVIYRSIKGNDFMAQFGFAVSLAGQSLLAFSFLQGLELFEGGEEFIGQVRLLAAMLVVLQALLFLLIPNFLHRIWSGVIGIAAATFLMIQFGLYPFTACILLATAAYVWLQEFAWAKYNSLVQALGYSLVFVCFAHLVTDNHVLGFSQFWRETFGVQPLGGSTGFMVSAALLGLVLLSVVWVLLKRSQLRWSSSKGLSALLLALLIAVIGIRTPGIPIALVFVLLGYAHGNKVLTGMGLITLLVFVSQFYYQLNLTLLYKSIVLFVSGLALLAVRQLMHICWPRTGAAHA
ncbi:MAG: DUF4401 domain-containing protein [Leucothrix sp.]